MIFLRYFKLTLHVTSRRLAGGQEQRSLATKLSNLIEDLPGHRQFYHTKQKFVF